MQADDIVARLRAWIPCYREDTDVAIDIAAAADRIEQLQAENATLRRLLDQFVGEFKDEVQREAL